MPDLRGIEVVDTAAKRNWTVSYLALTHAQQPGPEGRDAAWRGDADHPLVNWISSQSAPPLLPPFSAGSNRSQLIALLDAGHEKVRLSAEELERFSAWIDLGVPSSGDYQEAAAWTEEETAKYERYLAKRRQLAASEAGTVAALGHGPGSPGPHARRARGDAFDRDRRPRR